MSFDQNNDYPDEFGGHPPIDFPEAQFTRCRRVRIMGTTGDNVAWTRAINDNEDSDEDDDEMSFSSDDDEDEDEECLVIKEDGKEGYWLKRILRDAIYGRVRYALVVRKREQQQHQGQKGGASGEMVAWDVVVGEKCAVKEMLWTTIHELDVVEDPIKEVRAMQFIQRHYEQTHPNGTNKVSEAMLETRVMMPRDTLDDDTYMYSVMPFCDGGEFFNHIFNEETGEVTILNEDDARRWIVQILEAIETMQDLGIVHRDMSLENLMIHGNDCLVIDMGMTLRIPYENVTDDQVNDIVPSEQRGNRFLIGPLRPCGKITYMSPEIYMSPQILHGRQPFEGHAPFDGHAVDLWAVSVILFMMVAGFPPWKIPHVTDASFREICRRGHLEQICANNWNLGLSPQLIDLLQQMMWERPIDRLSLEQILAHPWITG